MNYSEIDIWLKNTTPGIIILGALGSIAAIGAIRAFKLMAPKAEIWLKTALLKVIIFSIGKIAGAAAIEHIRSVITATPHKNRAYYTSVIMKFCAYLFIMTWCLIFLLTAALFPQDPGLKDLILPSAFMFFFSGVYAIKTYCWLLIPHWLNLNLEEMVSQFKNDSKN